MSARHVQCHPHRSLVGREVVFSIPSCQFLPPKKKNKPPNLHIFGIFWNLGTFKKGMKNKISTLPTFVQGSTWRDLVDRSIPTPTSSWNVTWVESLSHFLPTNFQWIFMNFSSFEGAISHRQRERSQGDQRWTTLIWDNYITQHLEKICVINMCHSWCFYHQMIGFRLANFLR